MRVAVYLPLVLPLLAAVSARWLAAGLPPRRATWLLTASAVGLALSGGIALAALAATVLGQVPALARLGDWSVPVLQREDPTSVTFAAAAGLGLATAVAAAARTASRVVQVLLEARRVARVLPTTESGSPIVILDDPRPDAYALPGAPGRIVVSTGMLDALDEPERRILFAHERAHLDCRHHLFVTVAQVAAATNPLLRPTANAVRYCVERWADERAAQGTGDRRAVARTIGKAAQLAHRSIAPPGALAIGATSTSARARLRLWLAGPIPRRVAALLTAPPRERRWPSALVLGVLLLAAAACVETTRDLHALFHLAHLYR